MERGYDYSKERSTMNAFQKLTDITKNKLSLSKDILDLSLQMEAYVEKEDFDSFTELIDKRQDIIDDISLLDEQFVTLFEEIKKQPEFDVEITQYPDLGIFIQEIKEVIGRAKIIDEKIMPVLFKETDTLREKIRKSKNKRVINDKYSMDNMQKVTKDNFGIFIDEKQ